MATIPVEKKSGTPWWMWLLPLLLLLALLWYFLGRNDDTADQTAVDTTTQGPADAGAGADAGLTGDTDAAVEDADTSAAASATGATGGAITNAEDLYGESLASLVGRRVEIEDATVLSVTGDSTFYVGADGRRFLVALSGLGESASGPGDDGADGRFDIDTGDHVSVRGTVTRFDAANGPFGRLSETDRTEATTRGAFVNVTRTGDVTKR